MLLVLFQYALMDFDLRLVLKTDKFYALTACSFMAEGNGALAMANVFAKFNDVEK